MDCAECMMLLSASHDGESIDGAAAEGLTEHIAACPECSAFASGLAELASIPASEVPVDTVDRVLATLDAAGPIAPEVAAPTAVTPGLAAVPSVPVPPPWFTRTRVWTATGAIALTAAAIMIAVVLSQQVTGSSPDERAAADAIQRSLSGAPASGAPASPSLIGATPNTASAQAPSYIAFQGRVYRSVGPADIAASALTTVGVVTTALDSGGAATGLTALRWSTDPHALVLALPSGSLGAFTAVIRTLGGRAYQLTTDSALSRFGEWPGLPLGLTPPTAADGSPTFRAAGNDDLGVPVFVRIGDTPSQGVAVAPGTTSSDPAAGNPSWTWWVPIP